MSVISLHFHIEGQSIFSIMDKIDEIRGLLPPTEPIQAVHSLDAPVDNEPLKAKYDAVMEHINNTFPNNLRMGEDLLVNHLIQHKGTAMLIGDNLHDVAKKLQDAGIKMKQGLLVLSLRTLNEWKGVLYASRGLMFDIEEGKEAHSYLEKAEYWLWLAINEAQPKSDNSIETIVELCADIVRERKLEVELDNMHDYHNIRVNIFNNLYYIHTELRYANNTRFPEGSRYGMGYLANFYHAVTECMMNLGVKCAANILDNQVDETLTRDNIS